MNKHHTEKAVVTVFNFEWVQEKREDFRIKLRVIRRLNRLIQTAFDNLYKASEEYDITLHQAAYVYAINTVVATLKMRGMCT